MIEKVLKTIKKHKLIQAGESVVVGVSGGPDSVCLLHILNRIAEQMNIKVFAVHINHMLRGDESDADEDYVKEFCKELKIDFFAEALNVEEIAKKKAISIEEAGREARYEQFRIYAGKTGATKIAVAHNKNDQAETVLMNIIRGAGLDGLKGMEYKRGQIIRPLLDIERSEIENYCVENSLKPRIDSSNTKSVYTRNKIRLELVPYIDRLFGTNISDSVCRLAANVKDDIDYIEGKVRTLYGEYVIKSEKEEVWLDSERMKNYHSALIKRIIRNAVKTVKGDLKGIESKHVESVAELCLNGKTGSVVCLINKIRAEKSYNTLKIYVLKNREPLRYFEGMLSIPGVNYIENLKSYIEACITERSGDFPGMGEADGRCPVQFFDYEKLKTGIYIRYRKEGDIFKPFRSNGTKKLKEYFIDKKIPRDLRESIPLISMGNEIVWVIGYKISDKFKVTENTKYILKLEYKQV